MIDSNVGADARRRTGVLTFDGNLRVSKKVTYERMKGTEVPNPRRSSACDCTCVLTRNRSLSRDSHACTRIVLFLPFHRSRATYL